MVADTEHMLGGMEGDEEVAIVALEEPPFWNYTSITLDNQSNTQEAPCTDHPTHLFRPRFDLTFLLVAGGTLGVLVAIWIVYRAYHLLFMLYCRSLTSQCLERGTDAPSTNPDTIYVIDSCRESRGRVRGSGSGVAGMAGVLARMQSYRKGETPPPPYDSPPPYHVAIKMGNIPDIVVSEPVTI